MKLTLQEKKDALALYIAPASGRTREFLEVLYSVYPQPLNQAQIQQRLNMPGKFAFQSTLRNARIFIDIEEVSAPQQATYYELGPRCIKDAQCSRWLQSLGGGFGI